MKKRLHIFALTFVGSVAATLFIGAGSAVAAPTFAEVMIASNEAAFAENTLTESRMSFDLMMPIFTEGKTTMIDIAAKGSSSMLMNVDEQAFSNTTSGKADVRIDDPSIEQGTTFSIDGGVELVVIKNDLYTKQDVNIALNGIRMPFILADEQNVWQHEELDTDEGSIIAEVGMLSNEYSMYMEEILDMIPVDIALENGENIGNSHTMYNIVVDLSELQELAQEEIDYLKEEVDEYYALSFVEESSLVLAEQALDNLEISGTMTIDENDVMQGMAMQIVSEADNAKIHLEFSSEIITLDENRQASITAPIVR